MKMKLLTGGRVVLPVQIRRKLGLRTGDSLDTRVEDGRIVLTPRRDRSRKASIVVDPVAGSDAPLLSNKQGPGDLVRISVKSGLFRG